MRNTTTLIGSTLSFSRKGDAEHVDDRAVLEVTERRSDGEIEIGILNKSRGENDFYIRFSLPELLEKVMSITNTTKPEDD